METIHAVWIGSELSLLEQLVIRLFQRQSFTFNLWLYGDCRGIPDGVIVRNAEDILPRSSIFTYAGKPVSYLANGGIGSLAHWSDQFQFKLLYEVGGFYTQLDVLLLDQINFAKPYIFVDGGDSFQTCFMKCPKGSQFARDVYESLAESINPQTMSELSWLDSMAVPGELVQFHGLGEYFLGDGLFQNGMYFVAPRARLGAKLIHFGNASIGPRKNAPVVGSLYARLLGETDLWRPSLRERGGAFLRRLSRRRWAHRLANSS